MLPLAITLLAAILVTVTAGSASAGDRSPLGSIIAAATESTFQQGGFLRPGDSWDDYLPAEVDPRIVDNLVGYLIYFGNRADISLDRHYTINVTADFANPQILVATYHDTALLKRYAYYFGYDLATFVSDLGLPSADHQITTVPVGTIIARNDPGTNSLTFQPVAGDIGAYFIIVAAFDDDASGAYTISIMRNP